MSDPYTSSQAEQARERARHHDGRFGTYSAEESGATLGGIVEPGKATKGHMGTPGWIGGKHQPDRDITEIARDVRSDLKRAQEDGWLGDNLNFTVRTERLSEGRSLRVSIEGLTDDERLADAPDLHSRKFNPRGELSDEAAQTQRRVRAIVEQYNRDESNSEVDFFDIDFYSSVAFESEDDVLAERTQRETKQLTEKLRKAGANPGEMLPENLNDEVVDMRRRHDSAREDINLRKARRLASWRSAWAEGKAGRGSVQHTAARLREEVLDADLPEGWLPPATASTGGYREDEHETTSVFGGLDFHEDPSLYDPLASAVRLGTPDGRAGVEAAPVNTNSGEVVLRPFAARADHEHDRDTERGTTVHVDEVGEEIARMARQINSERS